MTNTVNIDITATDKAGLDKLAAAYRQQGKAIGEGLTKGFKEAEDASDRTTTKTTQNANKMGSAMKGAVSQMSRELDKLERSAAMSGDGISEEYASALAVVRADLARVAETGARTGAGLESDLGDALRQVRSAVDELKPAAQAVDKSFETAARSVSRDLYRIEQDAWAAGRGMDKAFQSSMLELRQQLAKARAEGARTGASLESDLGGALRQIREEAAGLSEAIKPPAEGNDFLERFLGRGAAAAAGASIGAALWQGIQGEIEEDKVGALIAASTDSAAGASGRLGDIAGDAFRRNFGDSVQQAGETITALFQNNLIDTTAPEASIQRLTERMLTLQQTTGEGANEISRSVRQMLVTGMADSVSEAMDMIQHATEQGMNVSDDLLDTIQEYSTSFREVGLAGQEAFGLIQQATDAGARNTDIAADAIKEFGIRAQDMSTTSVRGFQTLGLSAEEMTHKITQGGAPARDALRQVLNALQQMEPGFERNQAAVDLFGTKAEDLGDALYSMDLDTAAGKFDDFAGSVFDAANRLGEGQSAWDKFARGVGIATDYIGERFDDLGAGMKGLIFGDNGGGNAFKDTLVALAEAKERFLEGGDTTWLDEIKEKYPGMAASIDDWISKNRDQVDSTKAVDDATSEYIGTLDSLIAKQREYATGQIDHTEAQIRSNQAVIDAKAVFAEFAGQGLDKATGSFDLNTEAGQKMQSALNDIVTTTFDTIDAMRQQNATSEEVRGYMEQQRQVFYDLALSELGSADAAQVLTDKLFGLPDKVVPVVGIKDMASGPLQTVMNYINSIPAYVRTDYYMYTHAIQGGGGSVRDYESSYQGRGGRASGGISFSAASGGARHASTMINEAGPEVVELPDGSKVMTAGATRAMAESGLLSVGGGSGGPMTINLVVDTSGAPMDELLAGLIRQYVKPRGGNVQEVLGR